MKFSAVLAVATAALVSAQTVADIPTCAIPCLTQQFTPAGCDVLNLKCACPKQDTFVLPASACIKCKCSEADAQKAGTVAGALCKGAGVTVTIPSADQLPTCENGTPVSSKPAPTSAAPTTTSSAAPAPTTTDAPAPTTTTAVTPPAPTTTKKSPCRPRSKPRRVAY